MTRADRKQEICAKCWVSPCAFKERDMEDRCVDLAAVMDGYDVGQEDMLDKACQWLANNAAGYVCYEGLDENGYDISTFDGEKLVKDFRKAMEEQQ